MPVFYESCDGNLWLSHSIWDGVSLTLALAGMHTRHFSAQEERIMQLKEEWKSGDQVVNAILHGPKLFESATPFTYVERQVHLPDSIIEMVKLYSTRARVALETVWYGFMCVVSLQAKQKAAGVFWIQDSNRDPENSDVFGYITTEVGVLIEVDPMAPFEERLSQGLRTLTGLSTQHRSVFPELALPHPMNDTFMENSLGMNLLGNSGPDWTDRTLLFDTLNIGKEEVIERVNADAATPFLGNQSWIEIGLNNAVAVKGRADIVAFCVEALLPTLRTISLEGHEKTLELARSEASLSVDDRMSLSEALVAALDAALDVPHDQIKAQAEVVIVGAGLAGLSLASIMSDAAIDFMVFEKAGSAGGQWRYNANFLSRVNSSEPSYRLPHISRDQRNTNHTHHYEILKDILRLIEQKKFVQHVYTHSMVHRVLYKEGNWTTAGRQRGSHWFDTRCEKVALCINRRLGQPRNITYPGEEQYHGQVALGLCGESDRLSCKGERVAIIGMGAFAVESMRTTLERAAAHVTIVARQRAACSPHILDWMRFVRPFDEKTIRTNAEGDALLFLNWQQLYDSSGAKRHTKHTTTPNAASHRATPHHATPRHTTPHHTTPHHATPHHTTPHHTTPHHTTPHHTTPPPPHTPHHTTPHHTASHHTTPHHTTPHHITHTTTHHTTSQHNTPPHPTVPQSTSHTPHHTIHHRSSPHQTAPYHSHPTRSAPACPEPNRTAAPNLPANHRKQPQISANDRKPTHHK